jgi:hypothetical protein
LGSGAGTFRSCAGEDTADPAIKRTAKAKLRV